MANIWLVVFIAVFAAPIDALTSEVSNRTQEGEIRKRTFDKSKFKANFLGGDIPEHLLDKSSKYLCFHQGGSNNFFSTIFDQVAKSPILSAYVITAKHALDIGKFSVRTSYWKDNPMPGLYRRWVYDDLYSGVSDEFDKGHLNPFAINSFNQDYAESTFVYTNAVPQYSQWNRGAWKEYEKAIRRYTQMTCGCERKGTMYLMTGTSKSNVQRYGKSLQLKKDSQRTTYDYIYSEEGYIDVPKALWTAGCCVWKLSSQVKAESIAVMGNNTPYKGLDETMGIMLDNLEKLLGANVNLFPGVPACRKNSVPITVDYVDSRKSSGRKSRG